MLIAPHGSSPMKNILGEEIIAGVSVDFTRRLCVVTWRKGGGVVMGWTLILQSLQTSVHVLIRCSTALMHHLFLSPMVSCVLEESGNWFIFFHLCLCATDCAPTSAFRYLCMISRRKRPSRYNLCAMKHISSSGFDDRVFRLHKILWAFGH